MARHVLDAPSATPAPAPAKSPYAAGAGSWKCAYHRTSGPRLVRIGSRATHSNAVVLAPSPPAFAAARRKMYPAGGFSRFEGSLLARLFRRSVTRQPSHPEWHPQRFWGGCRSAALGEGAQPRPGLPTRRDFSDFGIFKIIKCTHQNKYAGNQGNSSCCGRKESQA
jgi:hypothetical protein